ncbi:FAD:protein FMN transferase [Rugosimonospora acidiphila]|uniref:FAD:protein FMN transferase n=1 Tax=Rugosimonospora acidiphila TaxID=556531 RepID=A0ABP9RQ13_9ACTN
MHALSERVIARHSVQITGATYAFCIAAPPTMARRTIGEALAAAVAELRAVDTALSPFHPRSLVSAVRRGELAAGSYPPPLLDIIERCDAMRAATDGWFDAWAVPGGFDPSGLVKGWAIDRAAVLLRAAGIDDYAITSGGDWLVRGNGPRGGAWRVGVADPDNPLRVLATVELTDGAVATSGYGAPVIDPHSGGPARSRGPATVTGPTLATADAYSTALYAAGEAGLPWFPTADGYRAIVVAGRRTRDLLTLR